MEEQEKHEARELPQSNELGAVHGHAVSQENFEIDNTSQCERAERRGHGQHGHTRAVVNRLSRAIGHLGAIKKMVEAGRDCGEVLVQLSAVKAQLTGVSKVILKDHLDHCIADAVREGDEQTIQNLKAAIDKLL